MNTDVARSDLAHEAEHASLGQNCCDASIGSVVLFISHSMPLDACFFQALLTFSPVSAGLPMFATWIKITAKLLIFCGIA